MGVFVDLHEKIRTRLNNAIAEGQALAGIQSVRLGYDYEVSGDSDFPFVLMTEIIEAESGRVTAASGQYVKVPCEFTLFIFDKIILEDRNHLYNSSNSTGLIYWKELLMDTLFTPDATFDGYVSNLRLTSEQSEMKKDVISTSIKCEFDLSKAYSISGRSQ